MRSRAAGLSRRTKAVCVGALAALVIGIVAPMAASAIGITIPLSGPDTTVTAKVLPPSLTISPPPTLPTAPDPSSLLGITDVSGGLSQTSTALNQLLAGLKNAANAAGPVVTGTVVPDLQAQLTALQTQVEHILSDIAALNTTAVDGDVMAAIAPIESEILGLALSSGLTSGLTIAQDVLSPTCALTAVPSSFIPGLGVDLSRTYKVASPYIQQTDAYTDNLIKQVYSYVYNGVISLLSANSTTATLPALLQLLQFNWSTTYEAPDGTRITKSAPGLINVPTPIDVDNSGTFDVCATASYALDSSGAITLKQTITKMPLAKATLPLQITAPLLAGVLQLTADTTTQPKYDTDPSATVDSSQSTVPIVYTTSAVYSSAKVSFDNTYSVHRGTTLTLPPASLNPLPNLPDFPPLTVPAPTPKITESLCLVSCSTLDLDTRYDNEANATHLDSPGSPSASAENLNFTGTSVGDGVSFSYGLLGGLIGVRSHAAPAPAALMFCASATSGSCSTAPHASTDKGSINFGSSQPIHFDNTASSGTGQPASCAGRAADVHIDGSRLNTSNTPPSSSNAAGSGKVWLDTGGQTISGCVGYGATVTGIPAATFAGNVAGSRDASYHTSGANGIPDGKSGSLTCPTGTAFTLGASTALTPVLCPVPPVLTAGPSITGEPVAEAPQTATSTWSPTASSPTTPNSPTLTYVWSRCDATGAACSPIAGATGSTYTPIYGSGTNTDIGHTLRVTVTGSNFDGSVTSAPSAPTAVIAAQTQAPGIVNNPTVSGVAGTGHTLTATSNLATDWNHGVSSLSYQWQHCNSAGTGCADISGATGTTYNVAYPADLDSNIQVVVTATNHVGATPATSAQVRIQPAPVNTAVPVIQRCTTSACTTSNPIPAGSAPFSGDKLKVTDGTWQTGTATAFAYQWFRCDSTGASCNPIAGATTNRYTVSKTDDLGKTLYATVTATNDNLDASNAPVSTVATSATTAQVTKAKPAVQPSVVPEGTVSSVAASGHDTTYIGGAFDLVGPAAGEAGAVVLSGTSAGAAVNAAGVTGGAVKAIASDVVGGYFIGGSFTTVQGVPCASFAHITSAGALDPAYCALGVTGEVRSIAVGLGLVSISPLVTRSTLVIGGNITVGTHHNLVFVDANGISGDAAGDPNGPVNALLAPALALSSPGAIWIGGDFTKIGTDTANHVARVDWSFTSTGTPPPYKHNTSFTPSVSCTTASPCTVNALSQTSAALLVGGSFDGAFKGADAPTARTNAAAFSITTAPGAVLGWNPNPNGIVNALATGVAPTSSVPGPVFLGGQFTHVGAASPGGLDVQSFAEYGITSTGAASTAPATQMNGAPSTAWVPTFNGPVTAISGTTSTTGVIAVGGTFTTASGQARDRVALYANQASAGTSAATLSPVTAHAGNNVLTLSRDAAGRLLVGGQFMVLGGQIRHNVAEISASTGLTPWTADTDGPVTAVAAGASNVYLAGSFTKVNGISRSKLAAVAQSDGSVTGWAPSLSAGGVVNTLAAAGDATVYAGGSFTTIGGSSRSSLAALDGTTGSATSWNSGGVTGGGAVVNTIVLNGATVYVGGSFTSAGGAGRTNAAAIAAGSGTATAWNPAPDGTVSTFALNPDDVHSVFIGGSFAHAGGAAHANIAKVDDATGAASGWTADASGPVGATVVFSGNLYLAGSFTSVGGQGNGRLEGVDATTGEVLDWQPTPSGPVTSMAVTNGGLIALGGSFVTFNPPVTATNGSPVFSYRPGFALLG